MDQNPIFSEKLWEWRLFSKTIHKSLLNMLQEFPLKFDRPTKMTDNYVWTPDCDLNIKLREQDLKIKELIGFKPYMDKTSGIVTYAEQWAAEVYSFPIPKLLMKRIGNGLGMKNISKSLRLVEDKEQFVELLQTRSNAVRVLPIFKQREQRLLPIDIGNKVLQGLVTVEISHLINPEDVSTLSIEHYNIENVTAGISTTIRNVDEKVYRSMAFMNYLQAVKIWGLGNKIYG
jgi:hypothetical protein